MRKKNKAEKNSYGYKHAAAFVAIQMQTIHISSGAAQRAILGQCELRIKSL